jgi:type IX secretion system substrate protein/PKD domain-containing protein
MKNFNTIILLSLLSISSVYAQGPNVNLIGGVVSGTTGTQVNLPFQVTELWNVTNLEGSIVWDTSVATFDTISSFALPYFDANTFDLTNSANGVITFEWAHLITIGSTLPDSSVIFTLRFDVVGTSGDSTLVELTNTPVALYWYNFAAWSGTIDVFPGQINVTGCATPVAGYTSSWTGWTYNFIDQSTGTIDSWLWDFGDGNTDTTANAIHAFGTADTFMVCLYVTNSCGTDSMCTQVITTITTGIDDVVGVDMLQIYPNPASNNLFIKVDESLSGSVELDLMNLQGKILNSYIIESKEENKIDVSDYPGGFYFLKARSNSKEKIYKIIVN